MIKELFIEELNQVTGGQGKAGATTLAIGEEGGSGSGGGVTTLRVGEEGGTGEGGVTTMAVGEEGGDRNPLPPFAQSGAS